MTSALKLQLVPIGLADANVLVNHWHRHHPHATRGHKFSVAVMDQTGEPHGVAIAGRPVSRELDDGFTLEVRRVATDGTPNACSMLYGACRRAGIAMGYQPERIITYTLQSESGSSLRAAGWHVDGQTTGGSWDTPARQRTDKAPTEAKIRWRAAA